MLRLMAVGVICCVATWVAAKTTTTTTAPGKLPDNPALGQQLENGSPIITLTDPKILSFRVEGFWNMGKKTTVHFRACRTDPQHFAFRMTHDNGTPLIMYADGRMFMYDVQHGVMYHFPFASLKLDIGWYRTKGLTFRIDPIFAGRAGDESKAEVDLRSIIVGGHVLAAPLGDQKYTFRCIRHDDPGGKPVVVDAEFDFARPTPMQWVSMSASENDKPRHKIGPISINEFVDARLCALPAKEAVADILPIKEVSKARDAVGEMPVLSNILAAAVVLTASDDPSERETVERSLGKIDWDALKADIAKKGPALRELVGESPTTKP